MKTKLDALREAYFHWLVHQVGSRQHQTFTYWDLLRMMHDKEFFFLIANDDNRVVDGTDLRVEFLHENIARKYSNISKEHFGPCSVLEVLIGLSRRLSFAVGDEPEIWAFRLIKNLKLETAADPLTDRRRRQIDARLDSLVWRTYFPTGSGGFFPLKNPQSDQTKKEIWAQMAEYINERYDFH